MTKPIAFFDMDGTLFDLNGRIIEELEKMRFPDEPPLTSPWSDQPWLKARRESITRVPGFWENLPRFELGWDVLEIAKSLGYEIHILTKGPSTNPAAWMEKLACIRTHLQRNVTMHITEDKSIHYGRVLVDDFPGYVEPWLKYRKRGLVIMPAHDYNADFKHPNVIRYDGTNELEVNRALKAAYSRKANEHWKNKEDKEADIEFIEAKRIRYLEDLLGRHGGLDEAEFKELEDLEKRRKARNE